MSLKDNLEVECQNCRTRLGNFKDGSFLFQSKEVEKISTVSTLMHYSKFPYDWDSLVLLTCPECSCLCQVKSDLLSNYITEEEA